MIFLRVTDSRGYGPYTSLTVTDSLTGEVYFKGPDYLPSPDYREILAALDRGEASGRWSRLSPVQMPGACAVRGGTWELIGRDDQVPPRRK